jgi:hypothetical protein
MQLQKLSCKKLKFLRIRARLAENEDLDALISSEKTRRAIVRMLRHAPQLHPPT